MSYSSLWRPIRVTGSRTMYRVRVTCLVTHTKGQVTVVCVSGDPSRHQVTLWGREPLEVGVRVQWEERP